MRPFRNLIGLQVSKESMEWKFNGLFGIWNQYQELQINSYFGTEVAFSPYGIVRKSIFTMRLYQCVSIWSFLVGCTHVWLHRVSSALLWKLPLGVRQKVAQSWPEAKSAGLRGAGKAGVSLRAHDDKKPLLFKMRCLKASAERENVNVDGVWQHSSWQPR